MSLRKDRLHQGSPPFFGSRATFWILIMAGRTYRKVRKISDVMSLCYELAGGAITLVKLFAQNESVLPQEKVITCFAFTNRGSHGKFDGIHVASSDKWVRFAKIPDTSGNVLIHQLLK